MLRFAQHDSPGMRSASITAHCPIEAILLSVSRQLWLSRSYSIDAQVLGNSSAMRHFFGFQSLLVYEYGHHAIPNALRRPRQYVSRDWQMLRTAQKQEHLLVLGDHWEHFGSDGK